MERDDLSEVPITSGTLDISVSHSTHKLDLSEQFASASLAVARATYVEPVATAGKWVFLIVALLVTAVLAVLVFSARESWDWRVTIAGIAALALIAVPITLALPKLLERLFKSQ